MAPKVKNRPIALDRIGAAGVETPGPGTYSVPSSGIRATGTSRPVTAPTTSRERRSKNTTPGVPGYNHAKAAAEAYIRSASARLERSSAKVPTQHTKQAVGLKTQYRGESNQQLWHNTFPNGHPHGSEHLRRAASARQPRERPAWRGGSSRTARFSKF